MLIPAAFIVFGLATGTRIKRKVSFDDSQLSPEKDILIQRLIAELNDEKDKNAELTEEISLLRGCCTRESLGSVHSASVAPTRKLDVFHGPVFSIDSSDWQRQDNSSVYNENGEKQCIGHAVSRRRRHGDMCSCRRRISGAVAVGHGLQPGWKCGRENKIVFDGIDAESMLCCCKAGACSREATRRGDARDFTEELGEQRCCKLKKGAFNRCPRLSGYKELRSVDVCTQPVVLSSTQNCATAIKDWLQNTDWYEVLSDWEAHKNLYADYVPCMQTRDKYVSILLDEKNNLKRVVKGSNDNPMRELIRRTPGCKGLSPEDIVDAVASSYDELCIFGMPGESSSPYTPDFNPKHTCAFDKQERRIILRPDASCPEGHRCACSVYSERETLQLAAGNTVDAYNYAYGGVMAVSYGAVLALGATAAIPSAFAIGIGAGVAAVTFGARYVWDTMTHSCKTSIGCLPMDCVNVPQLGCRMRPAETLDDARNPFWFMPPPTYKCHWHGVGCQLSQCTRRNLIQQRIGLYNSTALFGQGASGVYNCQPILSRHMTIKQRLEFDRIVSPLQRETQAHLDRMQALEATLEHVCAWKWPTKHNHVAQCQDGTTCMDRIGWRCCDDHGGIQRCPRRYPLMCNNGQCDKPDRFCRKKNGTKPCPAASQCPWLAPTNVPRLSECYDDEFCEEKSLRSGEKTCCAEKGGLRRCPPERPIMCEKRECNDAYCCVTSAKDCLDKGGPRICNLTLPPSEQPGRWKPPKRGKGHEIQNMKDREARQQLDSQLGDSNTIINTSADMQDNGASLTANVSTIARDGHDLKELGLNHDVGLLGGPNHDGAIPDAASHDVVVSSIG